MVVINDKDIRLYLSGGNSFSSFKVIKSPQYVVEENFCLLPCKEENKKEEPTAIKKEKELQHVTKEVSIKFAINGPVTLAARIIEDRKGKENKKNNTSASERLEKYKKLDLNRLYDLLLLKDKTINCLDQLRKDLLEKIERLQDYQDKLEGEIKLLKDELSQLKS